MRRDIAGRRLRSPTPALAAVGLGAAAAVADAAAPRRAAGGAVSRRRSPVLP